MKHRSDNDFYKNLAAILDGKDMDIVIPILITLLAKALVTASEGDHDGLSGLVLRAFRFLHIETEEILRIEIRDAEYEAESATRQ